MTIITFKQRWREELEAISEEGILVLECTLGIGRAHVYFPTEPRWRNQVPLWAKDQWNHYKTACTKWCEQNRFTIKVIDDAYVSEEKAG